MDKEIEKIILDIIYSIIKEETPVFSETINLQKNLTEYGFNSISLVLAIVNIENKFNIEFDDESLNFETLNTTESLINYVKRKIM